MLKKFTFITDHKSTFVFSLVCFFLSLLLILMSRNIQGFAQWYAVNLYPIFPNTIGRVFSLWNFSFFEAGILVFLFLAFILILIGFCLFFARKSFGKAYLFFSLRFLICFTSLFFLIYTMTSSINYQRLGIGYVLNLPIQNTSTEKLEKLTTILVEDLTALTDDPQWEFIRSTAEDPSSIETEAVNSMRQFGKVEQSLAGYYPQPKPIYFSKVLSSLGIEGIFSPFTIEANYNNTMTPFLIPYTICHEFAHLKGYMREDDAGFIAYLACKNSSSKIFQYSGAFHALNFTLTALKSGASNEEFNAVYQKLPERIKMQLSYIKDQDTKSTASYSNITKSVNQIYLIANAQTQGEDSYVHMVDLLLSEYADQINSDNMI